MSIPPSQANFFFFFPFANIQFFRSDALGHVLNMIGRDWTHLGVAKLYTDIVNNGYNIMYLTSRSTGQADTTRAYLNGVLQDGYRLPKGPVIMSPDRTIAALRREIYLRKPEVFKMACLRDILNLFQRRENPFYAGFGNRLTDALSYRSVNIPSSRIFTINSNAEVYMDLLSLNKYKSSYVTMRELVDHFFPPVSTLVQEGGEEFTDFNYWRDRPLDLDDFSSTDSESETSSVSEHDMDMDSDDEHDLDQEDDMHEEYSDEEDNVDDDEEAEEEEEEEEVEYEGEDGEFSSRKPSLSLERLNIQDDNHDSDASGDDGEVSPKGTSTRAKSKLPVASPSEKAASHEHHHAFDDPLDQSG